MAKLTTKNTQGYDLIGDVHGCAHSLEALLEKMGYRHQQGCYRHLSRKVIFVGDIVDRGPRIREALHIVKDMVDRGQAEIVLGNHEYNAMCYCTEGRAGSKAQYLREHNARNHRLIRETLDQFEGHQDEWREFLAWFHQIPLFLEKENFRVVHACWDDGLINEMQSTLGCNHMNEEFLHASMDRESFAGRLVDRLTRGTALKLPDGRSITAKDGFVRHFFRTKFWETEPEVYDEVVFQPDPLPEDIAQRPITDEDRAQLHYYSPEEKILFFGHYWMKGIPGPVTNNIACLDYSAVKYGRLAAYRMDNETHLDPNKFCWVRVDRIED